MLCYRDMTFCEGDGCAKFGVGCHRSLTEQVKIRAAEAGLPIARFANAKAQSCHEPKRLALNISTPTAEDRERAARYLND